MSTIVLSNYVHTSLIVSISVRVCVRVYHLTPKLEQQQRKPYYLVQVISGFNYIINYVIIAHRDSDGV